MAASRALGFVAEKRAFVSAKDKAHVQLTNVLMDGFRGGRIAISDLDYPDFLNRYADDIESGTRVAVIECKTAVFRFYADLDIEMDVALTEDQRSVIVSHFIDGLRPFFKGAPPNRLQCMLLTAPPKEKDGFVKNGMHLIFPNVLVGDHEALLIRENVVSELSLKLGEGFCRNSWSDAVDKAVYIGSGLRMMGSVKVITCPACKKRDSEACGMCLGKGRVDEPRAYCFERFFGSDGKEDATLTCVLNRSVLKQVVYSSIRQFHPDKSPEFERFPGAPSYIAPTMQDPTKPPRLSTCTELAEDKNASRAWKRSRSVVTDKRVRDICERVVRSRVNRARYGSVMVREISTDSTRSFYDVKVSGQGSSFCQNKMDDHRSNTVYFHITANGVDQRCFCRRPDVRKANVPCGKYRSAVHAIAEEDRLTLFCARENGNTAESRAKQLQHALQKSPTSCGDADITTVLTAMVEQSDRAPR